MWSWVTHYILELVKHGKFQQHFRASSCLYETLITPCPHVRTSGSRENEGQNGGVLNLVPMPALASRWLLVGGGV